MKRVITTLLILTLTLSVCFAEQQPKTLVDLIDLAKNNDLQQKIDTVTIEKLEIDQFEAYRKAGNIDYSGDDDNQKIKVYTIKNVVPKQADNTLKYQKIAQLKHADELAVMVENGIADYTLAKRQLEVKKAEIKLLESKAEAEKLKLKLGSAIMLDVIEADNAITEAKLNLIDLENAVTDALLELKKTVGVDFELAITYDIEITEPYNELILENVDSYIMRKLDVIKAVDNYNVQSGLSNLIMETYRDTVREYKQAVIDLAIAEDARNNALDTAKIELVADYNRLQVYYKNYQIALALQQIAEKELANNQTKLKLGVISKLDLAASEQALLERQFDVASAINKYNKAKRNYLLNLKAYDVDITPKEIDLNDIYYRN